MQPLPLGRSTFSALRQRNEVYVDKTRLIYELARFDAKVFLARPRRFGKSLLVSTFESLFAHGLRDFQGLAIEKIWTDRGYPVVRLDFSSIKKFESRDQFHASLVDLLAANFSLVGFQYNPAGIVSFEQQFRIWLRSLPDVSLVVLVDEYDAPLTAHLDDKSVFDAVRDELNGFYQALKECEGCIRFFFMTGITKFSHTSIFSAFNNLTDISLNPQYGALLGWTQEEVESSFASHIEEAAKMQGLSREEVRQGLKDNYDGFCFDEEASVHVYCPWSVLNYLRYPRLGFANYWYESGGKPTVLTQYLTSHALPNPISYGELIQLPIEAIRTSRSYNEISVNSLLFQAGYLTIRKVQNDDRVLLGYPNREVAVSMARLYSDELLRGHLIGGPDSPTIVDLLTSGSVEDVVDYFDLALNSIDYLDYPITSEAICRAYLQILLIGASMKPFIEVHTAAGRSDLEVEAGDRRWVFEFKYTNDESQTPRLLDEAVEQVKSRRYGMTPHGRKLIRVALVFNGRLRRFSGCREV